MSNTLSVILFALTGFAIGFAIVKFIAWGRARRRDNQEEEEVEEE